MSNDELAAGGEWPLSDSVQGSLRAPSEQDYSSSTASRNNSIGSFRLGPYSRINSFSEGDGLQTSGLLSSSPATTISSYASGEPGQLTFMPVTLTSPVTVSFAKGHQLFKLKYSEILIAKNAWGNLTHIQSADQQGGTLHGSLIHFFPKTKLPIPHIETPYTLDSNPPFTVSFLEDQTVNAAGVLFSAQPHYGFETWEDCVRFQETLLGQKLNFVAGMSQAKSRGRGEECISQNLRIWQSTPHRRTLMFFANSQRKEGKQYVQISLQSVEKVEKGKKSITLKFAQDSEFTKLLRSLDIHFLDSHDHIFQMLKQQVEA